MKRDMREASFQEMLRWVSFSNMQVEQAKLAKLRVTLLDGGGTEAYNVPIQEKQGRFDCSAVRALFFEVNAYERHDTAGKGE